MSDIWERIADLLEKKLAPGAYQLWVKPLRGKLENGALVLHAPNEFVRNHVQLRLQEEIMEAAGEVLSCTPRISFLCEHGPAPVLALADNTVQTRTVSRQMSLPVAHALPTHKRLIMGKNPDIVAEPGETRRR